MTPNVRTLIDRSLGVSRVRARAPLRLGFAGGGTDVSPFCDRFGGRVLNATINMYAYASLEVRADNQVRFYAADYDSAVELPASPDLPLDGALMLHRGVYRRIVREFLNGNPLPITVTTFSDAPAGSGLGSSSTLVVAMLEAYRELLALPLGEYEVAQLAYEIEREDVGQAGGKQDQYAATFGGINFMEFEGRRAIINPLRIRSATLTELECMLVLYFTGVSRESATIIREQSQNLEAGNEGSLAAMQEIRRDAIVMKEALLRNDLVSFAAILGRSWESKKRTAHGISNPEINRLYDLAIAAGALSGKVSGAGGGGFMFFVVDPIRRPEVVNALKREPGTVVTCGFTDRGAQAWRF